MEPHCIPRQLMVCKFEGGKRSVGSQKLRWIDDEMRDLEKCKLNNKWMHIAQHDAKWRSIVNAVVTELNEKAEEIEKIEKDKRKKRNEMRGSKYQIRPTYCTAYSIWLHFYSPSQGRSCHQQQKHRVTAQEIFCCHCHQYLESHHLAGLQVQVTVMVSYGIICLGKKLTRNCLSQLRSINEYLVIDWGSKGPQL